MKTPTGLVVVAALVFLATTALALDNPKLNVIQFRPSPLQGDILWVRTATEPAHLSFGTGLWFTWVSKPLRLINPVDGTSTYTIMRDAGVTELFGNVGLFGFMDVGLSLPLVVASGDADPRVRLGEQKLEQVHGFSLGDMRLSLKGTILGGNGKGVGLALAEDLSFPTANRRIFAGDENVTSTTYAVLDFSMRGWAAALNLGVRLKKAVELEGRSYGHQLLLATGLSAPILCGVLEAIGTMEVRTSLSRPFQAEYEDALDLAGGVRAHFSNLSLAAMAGGGSLKGYGSPAWMAGLTLSYAPPVEKGCIRDRDHDTVVDQNDACPDEPGPARTAGCPDQDSDGVADRDDRCPDRAGQADLGGCPDRDGDGIMDDLDICPDKPGPVQQNGCPDSDGDGVIDPKDACPNEPGPIQTSGCPDKDQDGVPDRADKCPDVYGQAKYDGCPPPTPASIRLTGKRIEILEQVHFETGKAVIKEDSFQLLKDVAKVLVENPHIRRVEIQGHTDNVGNPKKNLQLSQDRADAVRAFLIGQGVAADRLLSVGYGDTKPVADNKTEKGRAANRRVEFVIVE